jgi:hypothetical protein
VHPYRYSLSVSLNISFLSRVRTSKFSMTSFMWQKLSHIWKKIDLLYLQREMATKGIINCQREGGRRKKIPSLLKITHYYYKKMSLPLLVFLYLKLKSKVQIIISKQTFYTTSLLFCFWFVYKINVVRYSAIKNLHMKFILVQKCKIPRLMEKFLKVLEIIMF